jgi:hyperosmotically inducible periplasmic protein
MKNVFIGSWVLAGVLILGLGGCANTGEKTGEYVDDAWITSKVKSEMIASKQVSARNISVNTTQGVVTLTGTAATTQESHAAADIANGVKGVRGVSNDIRIQ